MALDPVDHKVLLFNFSNGFHCLSSALSIIKSYLVDRTIGIKKMKGCSYEFLDGLPHLQGSVLDPILFAAFINDVPEAWNLSKTLLL